jgi:hypothetical protein
MNKTVSEAEAMAPEQGWRFCVSPDRFFWLESATWIRELVHDLAGVPVLLHAHISGVIISRLNLSDQLNHHTR